MHSRSLAGKCRMRLLFTVRSVDSFLFFLCLHRSIRLLEVHQLGEKETRFRDPFITSPLRASTIQVAVKHFLWTT